MLYYLFEFLQQKYQFPGAGLYQFLSFRAAVAMIISLGFSLVFGQKIINYLITNQIGESIRNLGLKGENEKKEEEFINEVYYVNLGVSFNKKKVFNFLESRNIFPNIPIIHSYLF